MRHPVAGFYERKPLAHPRVSQLHPVFCLAEVNFLLICIATGCQAAFIRCRGSSFRKGLDITCSKPEHAYRARDVFHGLLTEIGESDRQLVPNLVVRRPGDTYPAGVAQRFQPRGNIDAVAVYIVTVNDDIADVDTDPEDDLLVRWNSRISPHHAALNVHRATYRIDHARKLYQHAVASGFDNTATVLRDARIDQFATVRLEGCYCP